MDICSNQVATTNDKNNCDRIKGSLPLMYVARDY